MKKQFTIIKVGYTKGTFGCSNEYFTCIYTDKEGLNAIHFKGLYGTDDRVSRHMEKQGYKINYVQSHYGKMIVKENERFFMGELETIEHIKNLK